MVVGIKKVVCTILNIVFFVIWFVSTVLLFSMVWSRTFIKYLLVPVLVCFIISNMYLLFKRVFLKRVEV